MEKLYFLCSVLLVESDKIIAKIDFEIQSHIKEYHPNNYHHEYEFLEKKKHNNYKKELSKRKNKKWKKYKEMQTWEDKKLESKGELTKSLNDISLSALIDKQEFSTSKVTERNESTDVALETVLDNDFHHTRFNNLAKNVTDNRAFRKKKSKQQRKVNIDTGKETDRYDAFDICQDDWTQNRL